MDCQRYRQYSPKLESLSNGDHNIVLHRQQQRQKSAKKLVICTPMEPALENIIHVNKISWPLA
jgi:hypothetical protein